MILVDRAGLVSPLEWRQNVTQFPFVDRLQYTCLESFLLLPLYRKSDRSADELVRTQDRSICRKPTYWAARLRLVLLRRILPQELLFTWSEIVFD
jgi:hypothetical protein